MDDVIERLLEGDQRSLSRLITLLEKGDPRSGEVLAKVYPKTGRAYCIGVTGPAGVGKSTLVDRLSEIARGRGLSVGILAIDPSSPYSGGAFLGDRIRMQRHYLDPEVFIRSMATREGPGGLSRVVRGAVRLLDAAGKDIVLVETVGVGQTELGIMGVADTVVVALMPEAGDIIQTLKAGLMEIADIFVVNKADREGSNRMVVAINSMLKMAVVSGDWTVPVLATQANKNEGILELYEEIESHRQYLESTARLDQRRRDRRAVEFLETVEDELKRKIKVLMTSDPAFSSILDRVKKGEVEPYSAASELIDGGLPDRLRPQQRRNLEAE